jgi:hypothetical protein
VTLVEFLNPLLKGGGRRDLRQRDVVLAVMYYYRRYKTKPRMTAAEVKSGLVAGKVPKAKLWNVSDVLGKSAPYVHAPNATEGGLLQFELTDTGERAVREKLGLPEAEPEVEHDVGALQKVAEGIPDERVKEYINEALLCLRVGALRAAVVFVWIGAVHTLRGAVWKLGGAPTIDTALKKHRPKMSFTKEGDFADVNDDLLLQVAQDLGVIDKSEKKQLKHALDLRNDCGHPAEYKPREHRVSAFIEDVIGIVWK